MVRKDLWRYGWKMLNNSYIISCLIAIFLLYFYRTIFSYTVEGEGKRFDVWTAFLIAVLLTFSFKLMWENSLRYICKNLELCSRVDAVLVVSVLFFLLLPGTRLNLDEMDSMENRMLAKLPSLWEKNGRINLRFGSQMEAWISDRFAGRNKLLAVHDYIDYVVGGARYETTQAFVGRKDWLFYKGNDSVKLFQNRLLFSEKKLMTIRDNLMQQKKWLESKGIGYVVFVAPNKEDVYSEYYPEGICKVRKEDRLIQLNEFLQAENSEIHIIYPLDELISHKEDGMLYYKNDTHWNRMGAYWGYCALMEDVGKQIEIKALQPNDMEWESEIREKGDLNPMLPRQGYSPYRSVSYIVPQILGSEMIQEGEDGSGNILHTHNPRGKYKAIIFRDSFARAMIPYLSESFGEVIYIWSHDLDRYADMIEAEKPDMVIHEMVSRSAQSMLTETPHWRLDEGSVNGI